MRKRLSATRFIIQITILVIIFLVLIVGTNRSLEVILLIFSLLMIVQGIFSIMKGVENILLIKPYYAQLVYGFASLFLGVTVIFYPTNSMITLGYILAGWLLFSGFINTIGVFVKDKSKKLNNLSESLFLIILSLIIFIFPIVSGASFVIFILAYIIGWIVFEIIKFKSDLV